MVSAPAAVAAPVTLSNGVITAEFDATGLLASITKGANTVAVKQTLRYYHAATGSASANSTTQKPGGSGSGNYIFQPGMYCHVHVHCRCV